MRWLWLEEIPAIEKSFLKMMTQRMTRVSFGTAASTFLLMATIQYEVRPVERRSPLTARLIKDSIYVDNVMLGGQPIEDATKMYHKVKEIFQTDAMNLQKWTSNRKA